MSPGLQPHADELLGDYTCPYIAAMTAPRGSGSIRQRRPGVWEIRVAAGTDPVTGRTLQRSVTFRGSEPDAYDYRQELAAEYVARRSVTKAAPMLTIAELLQRWLSADQPWRPSTTIGYRSNARFLGADITLAGTRAVSLTPRDVRRAFARWERDGASRAVIGGRFRVLRADEGRNWRSTTVPSLTSKVQVTDKKRHSREPAGHLFLRSTDQKVGV